MFTINVLIVVFFCAYLNFTNLAATYVDELETLTFLINKDLNEEKNTSLIDEAKYYIDE